MLTESLQKSLCALNICEKTLCRIQNKYFAVETFQNISLSILSGHFNILILSSVFSFTEILSTIPINVCVVSQTLSLVVFNRFKYQRKEQLSTIQDITDNALNERNYFQLVILRSHNHNEASGRPIRRPMIQIQLSGNSKQKL